VRAELDRQAPEVRQAVVAVAAQVPQVVEQASAQASQARVVVASAPGGAGVIAGLDAAAAEADSAFGPVARLAGDALGAIGAGVGGGARS
jgi:hypothetical protein